MGNRNASVDFAAVATQERLAALCQFVTEHSVAFFASEAERPVDQTATILLAKLLARATELSREQAARIQLLEGRVRQLERHLLLSMPYGRST